MPPIKSRAEKLADSLVDDGLLTPQQVEELLELQKKEGKPLLKLLVEKSYVTDVDVMVATGRMQNVPPVNLARLGIAPEIVSLIPKEVATNFKILPVSRLDNTLYLVMADPLNVLAIDDVKRITRMEIQPMIATEKAILDKLNNLDSGKGVSMEDVIEAAKKAEELETEAAGAELVTEAADELSAEAAAAAGEEAPVIKLANLIIVQAIKDKASDIHIEPFEKMVRLRYRIDGALMDAPPPPKSMQLALTSRIKIMSNLDISERRLPQDGRMRMKVGPKDIDLRVSFMPTVHGEKAVLRVLDKSNLSASMDKLG